MKQGRRLTNPIRRTSRPRRRQHWSQLSTAKLLDVRLCDLDVKIEGTELQDRVERLHRELEMRGIVFRPHVWLGEEWFTPDGVPGIAMPFYLAHPRLKQLERSQMLEVEGGGEAACMRILRHEAGHAIDNAYRLHFRRDWREVFGRYTTPYPERYEPEPFSRRFVVHLNMWYAQSHPAEDFAETFAVWLAPGSRWRQRYRGWPALRKLEYVDELMRQVAGTPPRNRRRRRVEPLHESRLTLREHYRAKKMFYAQDWPDFYDRDLRRMFSDDPRYAGNVTGAQFLRTIRPKVRRLVSKWTGAYEYTIDQVLIDMIDRCRELELRLAVPQRQARLDALMMVTIQTMNYLYEGHHQVAL